MRSAACSAVGLVAGEVAAVDDVVEVGSAEAGAALAAAAVASVREMAVELVTAAPIAVPPSSDLGLSASPLL